MSFGFDLGGIFQGIGTMVESSNEARTVTGCGKQPSCWFGSSCEEKKRVFNQCVANQQNLQAMAITNQAENEKSSIEAKARTQKLIIVAVIIALIIALIIIKKK